MTIQDVYIDFITRIERNMTNDNLDIDQERFVIIFNNAQNRHLNWVLSNNLGTNTRHIRDFVVSAEPISLITNEEQYNSYQLPSDYVQGIYTTCKATNKGCTTTEMTLHKVIPENANSLYTDFNNEPNLEWEESFYTIQKDLKIYHKGFTTSDVKLDYYRLPKKVEMEGYTREDGSLTIDIDPEWRDIELDTILKICTKMYHFNINDLRQMNIDLTDIYNTL